MKNILDDLKILKVSIALEILNKVVEKKSSIQIKVLGFNQVQNTEIKLNTIKNRFYLTKNSKLFDHGAEVTIKITTPLNLYFLKTKIYKSDLNYYFDNCDNFFELVRRKNLRYPIPAAWSQSAQIQPENSTHNLKTTAKIIEMSKAGMKLRLSPEIPRYEKNQTVSVKFKVHRRGDVALRAKVVHVIKNDVGGPTLGIQFLDLSSPVNRRLMSLYDDLAFYFVNNNK